MQKLLIHSLILHNQLFWRTIEMLFAIMCKMSLGIKIELLH